MDDKDKEIAYLRAMLTQRSGGTYDNPPYVPCRIYVHDTVQGEFPIARHHIVFRGNHACTSNVHGAVSVVAKNGKCLGIKWGEFEVLKWRENTLAADAAEGMIR